MATPGGVATSSPAIHTVELTKRFGSKLALAGLSMTVPRGEVFGFLGPNGAGKTTAVEIFEGLRSADEGDVEVLGERWRGDGLGLRRRLGIQLQETKFPDKLHVREVLSLFRTFYPRGLGAEHVVEVTVDDGASSALTADVLAGLPSVEGVAREGARWRLTVKEVHRAVPAVLGALAERGAAPTELTTHHASLEDVFMALTGRRLRDA